MERVRLDPSSPLTLRSCHSSSFSYMLRRILLDFGKQVHSSPGFQLSLVSTLFLANIRNALTFLFEIIFR